MRTIPLIAAVWLLGAGAVGAKDVEGLIAHYAFDEGSGPTLHDDSGHDLDGEIHGAAWMASGDDFALRFDGVDDYVDCGSPELLNLSKAVTLEAWIYPEATPGTGEPGVLGKSYGSYVLTYYTDGRCWWYISGGGNHCKAAVPTGEWHHLVGTFDGTRLRLYVDGVPAGERESKEAAIAPGGPFLMGTSTGEAAFTKGAHFKGMIDEVRVYDRALSPQEVLRHYRTTRLTHRIAIRPHVYPYRGTLVVDMDLRGLGEIPEGAFARVEVFGRGRAGPLASRRVSPLPSWGAAETTFSLGEPAAGTYELRAVAISGDGRPLGKPAVLTVDWPKRPVWEDVPGAKVLNNLVTELLDVAPPPGDTAKALRFANPREGWVLLASTAPATERQPVAMALDGRPLHVHRGPGTLEAMRYLAKGPHELRVTSAAGPGRVVVRAVPELVFAKFGADPHVHEYGKYDGEFLAKHVLPNVNVLVAGGGSDQEPFLRQWKSRGGKVLVECGVPGLRAAEPVTADEARQYWSGHPGMTNPLVDGLIADEFYGSDDRKYAAWTEAVRQIRDDEKLQGKLFYPYCAPMYGTEASREFIRTVTGAGWRFAFERYLPEQRTARAARQYLDTALSQAIASWSEAMPGAERQMIVCMGTFSQPPESLDVNPATNHKVFLDMQLNLLANDPACFGLGGVMTYLSSYTDEETVRWMGRLFRHYCIEGNSEPLSSDPLTLEHLQNPDFELGLAGWTVTAAEPGSVAAARREGFSWLQGRYPRTGQGDTVLRMQRSSRGPNRVSQTVKALQPGRLYSLRMYSGDYRDLSARGKHAVSIEIDPASVLDDQSFRHVFANCYSHHHGPFNREHRAWMNYHWIVFRAVAEEAVLTISDWAGPTEPAGPAGQELMMNFIQIQPYDK